MVVLGVDVGGTKTKCEIANLGGKKLAEGSGGAGNYQTCGEETAYHSMSMAVLQAIKAAEIQREEICYAVFGISGADEPQDLEILTPIVERIMDGVPFRIVHDAWIGLRAGTEDYVGIASICGTGAGHVGRNREGKEVRLRNLGYLTGNYGGGEELAKKALHYAFRSEEGTWEKSRLEQVVPEILHARDISEVCEIIRAGRMTEEHRYRLPIAVFELADEGDSVCRTLLSDMGYEEGRYAASVIRKLDMCDERIPTVLLGSLFRTGNCFLIDNYMRAVREAALEAYPVILQDAPVKGAVSLALDEIRGHAYGEE